MLLLLCIRQREAGRPACKLTLRSERRCACHRRFSHRHMHHPFIPDIPGLDSFTGPVVHTARWTDIDTRGKRVAVIGAGSTGVQVFSALQPDAAHITHFARTPQWVMWMPMRMPQPRFVSRILRTLPKQLRRALVPITEVVVACR